MSKKVLDKKGHALKIGDRVIIVLNDESHVATIRSMATKIIEVEFEGPKGPRIVKVRGDKVTKFSRVAKRASTKVMEKYGPGTKVRINGLKGVRRGWNGAKGRIAHLYHFGEMAMVTAKFPGGPGTLKKGTKYTVGFKLENLKRLKRKTA